MANTISYRPSRLGAAWLSRDSETSSRLLNRYCTPRDASNRPSILPLTASTTYTTLQCMVTVLTVTVLYTD